MKIYAFIPYSLEKNLGSAYNSCMAVIGEDDWGLLLDDDIMFCTRNWYKIMHSAIIKYPHIGLFVCFTNRIGAKFQRLPNVDYESNDMAYHMKIGKTVEKVNKDILTRLKSGHIGGFAMLISKKTWDKIGGAKETGLKKIDWDILDKCRKQEILVARFNEIYAYHWRRGKLKGVKKL
jgi:GT2 family glycosyltransferase